MTELEQLKDKNGRRLQAITSMGIQLDTAPVVIQALIKYLIPEEDIEQFDLLFHGLLSEDLDGVLAEIRKQQLTQGATEKNPGKLIVPGR